jgi:hypothetical protein
MKGDFTRMTFDPRKHYNGVRMQQGRVQLDADWNENLEILLHRIQTETIDVIGECGVPIHNAGFGVVTNFSTLPTAEQDWLTAQGFAALAAGDFYLTQGRAYVDGILVENDHSLPFSQQPFVLPKGTPPVTAPGIYLLWLDVWQRHITALEDPDIREVALGGPDTATRTQVIWQAMVDQVGELGENITCANTPLPWPDPSKGRLRARTHPEDQPEDPCPVPPGAGYKRLENQLYRVEIHKGSGTAGGPTFKWSRDNGSVVVAVAEFPVDGANDKLRTTSLGRDDVLGLHENDWVEVLDDAAELACQPGTLVQIKKIDPDNILTFFNPLPGTLSVLDADGNPTHLKVRRWDSDGELTVTVPADNDGYLKLEGGIEVKFEIDSLRTGDYWQIPARTVPGQYGDIEWEKDGSDPAALLPFGIVHHYCKLAVLTAEEDASGELTFSVEDCRKQFPPLTELPVGGDNCCSVTVGEGGDYADLQSAVDARPADAMWWTICVLPGQLAVNDTVTVQDAQNLSLSGCGVQCRLIGAAGKPLLKFVNGQEIRLEGLRLEAAAPDGALLFGDSISVTVANCTVINSDAQGKAFLEKSHKPLGPAIVVDRSRQVTLRDNNLLGLPAILADGEMLDVLRNHILGGGVQIIPPSLVVRIEDNLILNGMGPGIRLGGGDKTGEDYAKMYATSDEDAQKELDAKEKAGVNVAAARTGRSRQSAAAMQIVEISRNLIGKMSGSGIVTETTLDNASKLGDVDMLTISDNQIISCCKVPDVLLSERTRVGGGIAALGLFSARIVDNLIAENGLGRQAACGIFVLDGSDIDISGNVVLENGTSEEQQVPDSYQAGIAVQYVFGDLLGITSVKENQSASPGYPALRIHGNQVICPAGQALSVTAIGSVVVEGNSLATRERLKQPDTPLKFGEKGACVAILDLGLPIWLQDFAVTLQMLGSQKSALHMEDMSQATRQVIAYPDGRVMFQDNQVTFNSDQQETVESLGEFDNQWFQRAWNQAFFSALIISLDDISVSNNQFQATVPPYMLEGIQKYTQNDLPPTDLLAYFLKFIQVSAIAFTIRGNGNGLTEHLYSNYYSYASAAVAMNLTTGNEATHLYATSASTSKNLETNNFSLF